MSLGGWRAPSNAGSDGPKVLGPLPSARAQDRLRYSDPDPPMVPPSISAISVDVTWHHVVLKKARCLTRLPLADTLCCARRPCDGRAILAYSPRSVNVRWRCTTGLGASSVRRTRGAADSLVRDPPRNLNVQVIAQGQVLVLVVK